MHACGASSALPCCGAAVLPPRVRVVYGIQLPHAMLIWHTLWRYVFCAPQVLDMANYEGPPSSQITEEAGVNLEDLARERCACRRRRTIV